MEVWVDIVSMSNKYGKKIVDTAKKSATDAIKAASKRAIQKNAEETGDLIGNKVAGKITSISKKSNMRLPTIDEVRNFLLIKKKMHITRRKTTNYWWIKVNT